MLIKAKCASSGTRDTLWRTAVFGSTRKACGYLNRMFLPPRLESEGNGRRRASSAAPNRKHSSAGSDVSTANPRSPNTALSQQASVSAKLTNRRPVV
jgi:hypothetical protein